MEDFDDPLARAAGLVNIGGGVNLWRPFIAIVAVREEPLPPHAA